MRDHARMNAYSEDLRKKIVEALGRGTTKSEAARMFGVSRSSVRRYAKLAQGADRLPPRSAPALNPSSTRPPGGCSRKSSKNDPRRPCSRGVSSCAWWPGSRSASRP
jgi:transposase-like protein